MFTTLQLQQFRSYAAAQFEFEDGVNIIVGPNASGKTSIIEALLVLCTGGSYKGQDADLVQFGADWARLDARLCGDDSRVAKLQLQAERLVKSYEINDVAKARFMHNMRLPVVFFEPQHMNLLVGEPAGRRQFLDDILTAIDPLFAHTSKNYKRALLQRNTLLKRAAQHGGAASDLFVWDLRLSELGGYVYAARTALVDRLQAGLEQEYQRISGKNEPVRIVYSSNITGTDYPNELLKALSAHRDKDIVRGFTAHGPHRDDFVLHIRERDAKSSASRGETRSLLLALKVLELHELERAVHQKPILLLDDVFSELDGRRRLALAKTLNGHQAFITTTDADLVIDHFTDTAHVIPLV